MPTETAHTSPREDLWADAMRAERRGDDVAYERLLKDIAFVLRRLVRTRLLKLGLSVHEAEDVVQEILIGLHAKRHSVPGRRPIKRRCSRHGRALRLTAVACSLVSRRTSCRRPGAQLQ